MKPPDPLIDVDLRELLHAVLWDKAYNRHGKLDADDRARLRCWLQRCIADPDVLQAHLAVIRGHDPHSLPTGGAFAGVEERVGEGALEDFSDEELVHLAANPWYLPALAAMVIATLPDGWVDHLVQAGAELQRKHNLRIRPPPLTPPPSGHDGDRPEGV